MEFPMAINLKGKKTSLKEDASIYQKHPGDLSEKEKLKTMSGKQKRSYFATYYLPPILIALAALAVVGYILWSDFINKADIYLHCAILNESAADGDLTRMGMISPRSWGWMPIKINHPFMSIIPVPTLRLKSAPMRQAICQK